MVVFELDCSYKASISLDVWDKDTFSADDFMGTVPEHFVSPSQHFQQLRFGFFFFFSLS